jgi:hypothetical protein
MINSHNRVLSVALNSGVQIARSILGRSVKSQKQFRASVQNKTGLQIGGPSQAFRDDGILSLYRYLEAWVIACILSKRFGKAGRPRARCFPITFKRPTGLISFGKRRIYMGSPAITMSSSWHLTVWNTLRIQYELSRNGPGLSGLGGSLMMLLPNCRHTFDHRRPPTSMQHMLADYTLGRDEKDLTHLDEILSLHALSHDSAAGSKEQFRQRSLRNFENLCLHHHVFDEQISRQLLEGWSYGGDYRTRQAASYRHPRALPFGERMRFYRGTTFAIQCVGQYVRAFIGSKGFFMRGNGFALEEAVLVL